jgi:hypothetical protein
MARNENPPFGLGETFSNNFATSGSTADGTQYEGKEYVFEDNDPVAKLSRTNQYKRVRIVRNISAGNLLPKRLVQFGLTPNSNGAYGGQVDGYAFNAAQRCYPVDEFLPAAGVEPNDLFYIVVDGPAVILTDLATLNPNIAVGDNLVNQTGATSGATTAGRLINQNTANLTNGATSVLANQIQNLIGRAMSAATTNQTNTGILVQVGKW